MDSTFPFLSRTGNVWQAFLLLALAFLPFYKNSIRRINIRIDSKRSLLPYGSHHSRLASFRMLSIGEALALLYIYATKETSLRSLFILVQMSGANLPLILQFYLFYTPSYLPDEGSRVFRSFWSFL